MSQDAIDMTQRIVQVFHAQPIQICLGLGLFVYTICMYYFMLNEYSHVKNNPKVQYHLKMIKEDDAEFEQEQKGLYQKTRRKQSKASRGKLKDYFKT